MSNTYTALGKIVDEPQLKEVNNTSLLKFKIADNNGYGDRQTTNWVYCDVWGKQAVNLSNILSPKREVMVSGTLTSREYVDNTGANRTALQLRCNEVTLTSNKAAETNVQSVSEHTAPVEDDMPF